MVNVTGRSRRRRLPCRRYGTWKNLTNHLLYRTKNRGTARYAAPDSMPIITDLQLAKRVAEICSCYYHLCSSWCGKRRWHAEGKIPGHHYELWHHSFRYRIPEHH